MKKLEMFYNAPTRDWNCALPIGCGKLGAMIFGKTACERIQLNEDSVWYGGSLERVNPEAYKALPEVRRLLAEGSISRAEELVEKSMVSLPASVHPYQTLGELYIRFRSHSGETKNYMRVLDLETAVARVSYDIGTTHCEREMFASYPENAIIIRLTFSEPSSFDCHFDRGIFADAVSGEEDHISLCFDEGKDGVSVAAVLRGSCDGTVRTVGADLCFEDASEATLVISAATTYREKDPLGYALSRTSDALAKPYESLKDEHISDYSSLFSRMSFELCGEVDNDIPTDERLGSVKDGAYDPILIEQYFQFGRYLLISSSREGSLPPTLQGIWNSEIDPPWGSKYTININTEMNYWPAEVCNLADCHEPLFELLRRMKPRGEKVARDMYGCRGFVAHHNTDIWGDCAPFDRWIPSSIWPMGAAWLSLHMWEHYCFDPDKDFLREAYPILRSAALFFSDYLVSDKRGRLVTSPSVSPENTYILPSGEQGCMCEGPSMDSQIVYDLLDAVIKSAEILDTDAEFASELRGKQALLPRPEIGRHGQIMEWSEDYDELEPGHRHISHLYALYPSWQLDTPELLSAARRTLERRLANGGGHTGWSRAWIINMWARLGDGAETDKNIRLILQNSTSDNLFDMHPPFQIDGNFGAVAGIAESLIQSQSGEIVLLPALPESFSCGRVSGLRARGGAEVDIEWADGKLRSVKLASKSKRSFTFSYMGERFELCPGETKIF